MLILLAAVTLPPVSAVPLVRLSYALALGTMTVPGTAVLPAAVGRVTVKDEPVGTVATW